MSAAELSITDAADCIAEVGYATHLLTTATTLPAQASALTRLSNAVADLETWHPDFDIEMGRCWRYEEEIVEDTP